MWFPSGEGIRLLRSNFTRTRSRVNFSDVFVCPTSFPHVRTAVSTGWGITIGNCSVRTSDFNGIEANRSSWVHTRCAIDSTLWLSGGFTVKAYSLKFALYRSGARLSEPVTRIERYSTWDRLITKTVAVSILVRSGDAVEYAEYVFLPTRL